MSSGLMRHETVSRGNEVFLSNTIFSLKYLSALKTKNYQFKTTFFSGTPKHFDMIS